MNKITILLLALCAFTTETYAQAPTYKVYALRYAEVRNPTPISVWSLNGPKDKTVKVDFVIWLIKGSNGENILVDAGFLSDIPEAKEFDPVNYVRPDSVLMKIGVRPENITDIILSHPHWDHIDGIGLFPNAHIWIQKDDYNYFIGALPEKPDSNSGYNQRDIMKMKQLNTAGKVTLVGGDNKQLMPGITVYTGSRHTYNSQYVRVKTGKDRIILASDNIWIYYSLEHMVPASVGGTLDPAGYVKAMKRMKTLASDPKYIIPGHDARMFVIFPKVADGVVQIR
ncbi:N-acyl homoserine lactonase family protein [Mucilaginibacter sp.]|jgi:glyoxylase-like metal-dependent hydrolase (beta-lactamase superfamily II)|uniref:N-acyl homoserine lactonase family protein n=1 Tax=Mucilaginibacter sp. TaxID=1882438 RepID=UPI002CD806EB|nr:N-acyl homoserine lactonase family protein [Mucilaginibacter sp.]HTI57436.1 N-acyl homoserine lactonase family protein [Mucilaginibacter sp.]